MIAIRHLNSDPEIAEPPSILPHSDTNPTKGSRMTRSQPSTWWSTLHTSPLCSNTGAWHPEENSHSRKHFPWHPRFTQTLLYLLFSPSVFHTLTLTDRERSKPHLRRPPSPQLLPGDVLRSHEWTAYRAIHREHPCSTMWQPRGQRKNPAASHCNEHQPPSKLASPGRFYCLLWSMLSL